MKGCRTLSQLEVKEMLDGLSIRDRLLMLTGLTFGTRISESLSLTFGNVAGTHIYIKSAKGSDNAAFPIPSEYRAAVEALRAAYGAAGIEISDATPLFLSCRGTTMTRQGASQIIKSACEALGIGGKVNSHSFRKTFVTAIYRKTGFDIAATKRYSRHKSLSNLDYYISTAENADLVNELKWT